MDLRKIAVVMAVGFVVVMTMPAMAGLSFSGGGGAEPVEVSPESASGLRGVYVLAHTEGVTATYTAASASANVTWQRYSNLGGGYAEPLQATHRPGTREWSVTLKAGDWGLIIEEGNSVRDCYWVTDYSQAPCDIQGLEYAADLSDCDMAALQVRGDCPEMAYYGVNGRKFQLSRDLEVTYQTLVSEEQNPEEPTPPAFVSSQAVRTLPYASDLIHVPAALCQTAYVMTGDRFLAAWGQPQHAESQTVEPMGVDALTRAVETKRDVPNEKPSDTGSDRLGGSAPCEITFEAAVTDAAIFHEWQMSTDPDFGIPDWTTTDLDFTYIFEEAGTTYIRFIAANADGGCEYYGETYSVGIGDSRLECPNAFSPANQDGVNDEWRVSYRSIVEFDCHIYNRWGGLLAHLTDPSQGWDGKKGSGFVPAGVYFYVIKALGSDGKKYNLAGDINIINYNRADMESASGGSTVPDEGSVTE